MNIKFNREDLKGFPQLREAFLLALLDLGFKPTCEEKVPTKATARAAMVKREGSTFAWEMALSITPNRPEPFIEDEGGRRVVRSRCVPVVVYFAAATECDLAEIVMGFSAEVHQARQQPKVGRKLYVPSCGSDMSPHLDRIGGLATVKSWYFAMSAGKQVPFVEFEEFPGAINYILLLEDQEKLRAAYEGRNARHEPDWESREDGFPRVF